LLAALGIGALSGSTFRTLDQALGDIQPTPEAVTRLEHALDGFQAAARTMSPTSIIDPLTSQIAVVDILRQRASPELRRDLSSLQARYAECLSWLHEEVGDVQHSLYWIDRAMQWAQVMNWTPMVAYCFVRRSMLALSYADNGPRAVENALATLHLPGATARVKGLAAKQLAFGFALMQRHDDSSRALDLTMNYFAAISDSGDDARSLGQRSVASDDLFTIWRATCDVYLGHGEPVISVLQPCLVGLSKASVRTHTITSAKLVHAYARAGAPEVACSLLLNTLDTAEAIGSLSAKRELHRALPALTYWNRRSEVQEVVYRLGSLP
jgi:hypothetical protein